LGLKNYFNTFAAFFKCARSTNAFESPNVTESVAKHSKHATQLEAPRKDFKGRALKAFLFKLKSNWQRR